MARKALIRGMGSLHRVESCPHGQTQAQKDAARCQCKWVGRFYDLTGRERQETYPDYETGWESQFDTYTKRRQKGRSKQSVKRGKIPTIVEYFDLYVQKRRTLKPGTVASYRSVVTHQIAPKIGRLKITDVSYSVVSDFIDQLYAERTSDHLVTRAVTGILKPMMDMAIRDGYRLDNPCVGHELKKYIPKRRYAPTPEEIHTIAHLIDPRLRTLIYLMSAAGLRIGEAMAATPEIIHDENTLRIMHQWDLAGNTTVIPLKHRNPGEFRDIPLDPVLKYEIQRHCEEFGIGPGEWLFPSPSDPDKPLSDTVINKHIRRAVVEAGLGGKLITAHNFRHAYGSHLILLGVPLPVVSRILGHQNIQTTYQTYFHLLKESWDDVRAAVNVYISRDVPEIAEMKGVGELAEANRQKQIDKIRMMMDTQGITAEDLLKTS